MRLIWTTRGQGDLARIWLFLAKHDSDIADRITREIQARCDRLTEFPKIGSVSARTIRQWSISKIGYIVTYMIDDDRIRVLRVHYARENREKP